LKGHLVYVLHTPVDPSDPILYEIGFMSDCNSDYAAIMDPETPNDMRSVYIIEFLVDKLCSIPFSASLAKLIAEFILVRLGGANAASSTYQGLKSKLTKVTEQSN